MEFLKTKVHHWMLAVFALVLILRFPSFFEPHWYGDEAIYLAIGQALGRGAVLYRDIWDNKTPLLYLVYAIHPTLLWAKVSVTLFVLGTTGAAYFLGRKLFSENRNREIYGILSALLVGVFLSLPIFEGTIANAELYFTFPIVWGAFLAYRTMKNKTRSSDLILLGFIAVVAFLFKVPALFDFLGFFLAMFIKIAADENLISVKTWGKILTTFLPVVLGFLLPFCLVVVYFISQNALNDFVTAAFLQNASYVSVGAGPLSRFSNPLFLHGLVLLSATFMLWFLYERKTISVQFLLLSLWFGFSIYGTLLSNRTYPHYLLQAVPAILFLAVYIFANLRRLWPAAVIFVAVLFWLGSFFGHELYFVGDLLKRGEIPYYQNYFDYMTGHKTWEQYASYFDPRTLDNYRIGRFIETQTKPTDTIFVWADNAFYYVLSDRAPATKFIQAHHLTTIPASNYDYIISSLEKKRPAFIVVTEPEHFAFPKLDSLILADYRPAGQFGNVALFRPATH